jgi:arabinogalactan endo-1,4-beta-galactosidase
MQNKAALFLLFAFQLLFAPVFGQADFYRGADLSYVNEMEDCGVRYKESGAEKDPYAIFADNGANMVRLRLWHAPRWYDTLNDGRRYSDLADVKRSMARAQEQGMDVLLDFHFSDTWADPGRQIVPAAWADVVDNLPALQDSLYNYIYQSLLELDADGLLPAMVQIGNETNKGILQSEAADAAGWALDWPRNAALFNTGIRAVREAATRAGKEIEVAIHIAGPENAAWLLDGFAEYGVTDFDVVGLSYYWAWHQPTTIQRTGAIIAQTLADYPGKQVMVFETGYLWTTESNDSANNIISSVQPGYAPASPQNQRQWLIDLTQEVINRGGSGVLYWEPAWVSSTCRTQWGQGSHQEHATFFDFDSNVLPGGGMNFFDHPYDGLTSVRPAAAVEAPFRVLVRPDARQLTVTAPAGVMAGSTRLRIFDMNGRMIARDKFEVMGELRHDVTLPELPVAFYVMEIRNRNGVAGTRRIVILQE